MNQTPYLTPYLGLRARLSQIWINRWTVLLLLVLVRTLLAIASINSELGTARAKALAACTEVENVGSSMASMPHYMSQGVNELTATGVEKAVNGLLSMLSLSVTGVEEIAIFVVHMMTSTYLCLITLAVSGSLHAAVELGTDVSNALNATIKDITGDVANTTKSFTDDLNKFLNTLKGVPFAGGSVPKIDLTNDINRLNGLQLPSDVQNGLQKLNQSIPTFEDVQNFTDNIIREPFEAVQKLINDSLSTFTFNRSLLPVPAKEQLTFCSDNGGINGFFDKLVRMEVTARKVFIALLVVAAILVCIPMAYREIRRYRWMEQRAQLITKTANDPMDAVYLVSRPYTSTAGLWLGNRFGSTRRQTVVRWVVAYATTTPALLLLSLGVAGLLSCLCQYVLVRVLARAIPELTDEVADFASKVVGSLDHASSSWADGVNSAVNATSHEINGNILGWVNTTTVAINDTLNTFVDKMHDEVNQTFGGTVLAQPIQGVLDCLITLKVTGISKALTWVSDHAHVDFPLLANDTFSLGTAAKISNSSSAAELLSNPGSTTKDDISAAVDSLTSKLLHGIGTEATLAAFLVLLWVVVVLMGIVRAWYLFTRHGRAIPESSQAGMPGVPAMSDAAPSARAAVPAVDPPSYDNSARRGDGYTLQPRPFPTFEPEARADAPTEKLGVVGAHHVAESARPGHLRNSSYGDVADRGAPNEKPGLHDPFAG